ALEYYLEFIDQHGDDPRLQKELTDSIDKVVDILSEVEGRPAALAFLDNARAKVEKRVREHPNDDRFHRGLSRVQANLFFLQGGRRILLLRDEAICDDLKLTDEQREKVAKITDDVHKNHEAVLKNLRDLDPAGQRSAFNKLINENETTLESVLAPRQ